MIDSGQYREGTEVGAACSCKVSGGQLCLETQCWLKQLELWRQCTFCIMGQQVNGLSKLNYLVGVR